LGGLFFILSALAGPILELAHSARGRSSRARWRRVGRHFALAAAMMVAIAATISLVRAAVGFANGSGGSLAVAPPLPAATITLGLLALLLGIAKCAELAGRGLRAARRPLASLAAAPTSLRRRLAERTEG
jgi:hypothetical protein